MRRDPEELARPCMPTRPLGTEMSRVAHNALYTYQQNSPLRKRLSLDGTGWSSRDNLVGGLKPLSRAELEEAAKPA